MKMKTGLLALGMFTIAGAVTISCGGSSDTTDNNGSTAGTTSTAGNGTGGNSTAGTPSGGGTTNNNAGTTNNNGGTANNNGGNTTTGGTNNNAGGDNGGPAAAGDNAGPGAGGAGPMGCPATQPMDGDACMRGDGGFLGCTYGDQNCRCQRGNGQNAMRTWQCNDATGAGGAGPGGGATCPADAMTGDDCTNGPGLCAGQQCFCGNNDMVTCF
jgi:hypothetical protein